MAMKVFSIGERVVFIDGGPVMRAGGVERQTTGTLLVRCYFTYNVEVRRVDVPVELLKPYTEDAAQAGSAYGSISIIPDPIGPAELLPVEPVTSEADANIVGGSPTLGAV